MKLINRYIIEASQLTLAGFLWVLNNIVYEKSFINSNIVKLDNLFSTFDDK